MGRWKRKAEYYKKSPSSSMDTPQKVKGKSFSGAEYRQIRQYLKDYKDGCHSILQGNTAPSGEQQVSIGSKKYPIVFPPLNEATLTQPYLALPASLSAKQRQSIHFFCTKIDIFHEAVTPASSPDTRYIVVSIFANGFDHLPESILSVNAFAIPAGRCKPWFCQTDQAHVKTETKKGRQKIEVLMDQPSQCLREEHDTIDFAEMEGQDLSHIAPPEGTDDWLMVDNTDTMRQCAQELIDANPTEIAFDLEFWNPSKYLQVTCLLQLSSSAGKDYVVDTLAPGVWEHVSLLQPLFADPSIVKIGHCISGDVQSLHRDFGIVIVNAFDTYEASKVLNLPKCGLADVCNYFGLRNSKEYVKLKAKYQATDWRRRPLTEPMIRYGRYDVHYLVALRQLLMRDLTKDDLWSNVTSKQETERVAQALAATLRTIAAAEGDEDEHFGEDDDDLPESNLSDDDEQDGFYTPDEDGTVQRKPKVGVKELRMQPDLMRTVSLSQQRCLDLWTHHTETLAKNGEYGAVMKQAQSGEIEWTNAHALLLEQLIDWRSQVATKEACLPGMVCSLDLLVLVASKRPTSVEALRRIRYKQPDLVMEYVDEVLFMVQHSGVAATCDIPVYSSDSLSRGLNVSDKSWTSWVVGVSITTALVAVVAVGLRKQRR